MIEVINIQRNDLPKQGTRYWRSDERPSAAPPPNFSLAAYEYRSFLIAKRDQELHFWNIRMQDETDPPVPLMGSYTTKEKAERAIDEFIAVDLKKQKEYEDNRN